MSTNTTLEELKARQQKTWQSGDYGQIAWLTQPLGDVLCDAVNVRPGSTVLDVAAGTGHVALAAARRFCHAVGVDYVPALLETARLRADAERLSVEFREADAERLPFPDASFDYVLSAIGVMFTADHAQAASELVRVCKPAGTIGMVNWTPSGFVGGMLKIVSGIAPPPPGAQPATRWGTEEVVRDLLGDQISDITAALGTITMRFPTPAAFADHFLTNYGPMLQAALRLEEPARQEFRATLIDLANQHNRSGDATAILDWEYCTTVATKR